MSTKIDKRRIGQLLMAGYQGDAPADDVLKFSEEWGLGGVIVFTRNLSHPEHLPKHIERFAAAAGRTQLVSIDQEGGLVLRLLANGSPFPGAMALAATGNPDYAYQVGKACAREMRALGLNFNLAPVLDINHPDNPGIGARSFGDTPERVIRYAIPYIKGLHDGGVLACAKHFPGKGHAFVDSHLSLPTIPYDAKRLREFELVPFKASIDAGVGSVMTSHVFFPAFETAANLPATMSPAVLTGLLRNEMKFDGLLITDDLEMGAITNSFGIAEAARQAFAAGADILLICHRLSEQRQALEAIQHWVENSPEGMKRLEESERRWHQALEQLAAKPPTATLDDMVREHAPLVVESTTKSILVQRGAEQLPVPAAGPDVVCCPRFDALVQVEESQTGEGFPATLQKLWPQAKVLSYDPKGTTETLRRELAPAFANKNGTVLLLSYNAHLFADQARALRELAMQAKKSWLAALRNPFDVNAIPEAGAAVATFGFRTIALQAMLDVLQGKVAPRTGPWPVDLPAPAAPLAAVAGSVS